MLVPTVRIANDCNGAREWPLGSAATTGCCAAGACSHAPLRMGAQKNAGAGGCIGVGGASYGADAFVGGEEQGEGAGADVGAGDGLVAHGEDLLGRVIAL